MYSVPLQMAFFFFSFFFLDFVVWAFVYYKQPQEGSISSSEFQPMHKNKFENHSDRGRCDGLRTSTNISLSPFVLADFLFKGKKKALESGYSHRGTTCR